MWHTCSTCHSEGSSDRTDTVMKSGISLHFRNKQQGIIEGCIHHGYIHASSIIWYIIHFQNKTILVTEMETGVMIRRMVKWNSFIANHAVRQLTLKFCKIVLECTNILFKTLTCNWVTMWQLPWETLNAANGVYWDGVTTSQLTPQAV